MSQPAFALMDDVVTNVFEARTLFWVTAGFVLALWEISGAVRAVMGAVNRVYACPSRRSWRRRMLVSTALGLAVGACLLGGGRRGPDHAAALRRRRAGPRGCCCWCCAGRPRRRSCCSASRSCCTSGPSTRQPLGWVTRGTLMIMVGWLVMSAGFGLYLRYVADYNSIFGGLASVVVLIAYLYAAAVVFLGGVQVDALIRA